MGGSCSSAEMLPLTSLLPGRIAQYECVGQCVSHGESKCSRAPSPSMQQIKYISYAWWRFCQQLFPEIPRKIYKLLSYNVIRPEVGIMGAISSTEDGYSGIVVIG